jgi:hypothetical protein
MNKAQQAKNEIMATSGVMSDCCCTAITKNKDGADICWSCLEACDSIPFVEKEKDDRIGNMLYNALETMGYDGMCAAIMEQDKCAEVSGGGGCSECPFDSEERSKSEMTSMEL